MPEEEKSLEALQQELIEKGELKLWPFKEIIITQPASKQTIMRAQAHAAQLEQTLTPGEYL